MGKICDQSNCLLFINKNNKWNFLLFFQEKKPTNHNEHVKWICLNGLCFYYIIQPKKPCIFNNVYHL
jgi:hypothetical protein